MGEIKEKLEKVFKEKIQADFEWTKNLAITCYLIYSFEINAKQTDWSFIHKTLLMESNVSLADGDEAYEYLKNQITDT